MDKIEIPLKKVILEKLFMLLIGGLLFSYGLSVENHKTILDLIFGISLGSIFLFTSIGRELLVLTPEEIRVEKRLIGLNILLKRQSWQDTKELTFHTYRRNYKQKFFDKILKTESSLYWLFTKKTKKVTFLSAFFPKGISVRKNELQIDGEKLREIVSNRLELNK